MWRHVTGKVCFKDVKAVLEACRRDPELCKRLWTHAMELTLPCIDYTRKGGQRGEDGPTGQLWPIAVELALLIKPVVLLSEQTDFAEEVCNGKTLSKIKERLRTEYVVHVRVVEVWKHGDGSHRKRLLIVAVLRTRQDLFNAEGFKWPVALYDETTAITGRDLAVPDHEVPPSYWRTHDTGRIFKRYVEEPKGGKLHRICRFGEGMGSSYNPNLVLSHSGLFHTGTTQYPSGGGGQYLPLCTKSWNLGSLAALPYLRLRLRLPKEWYRAASVSDTLRELHIDFMEVEDGDLEGDVALRQEKEDRHCLDCINQGWPAGTARAHAAVIAEQLQAAMSGIHVVGGEAQEDELNKCLAATQEMVFTDQSVHEWGAAGLLHDFVKWSVVVQRMQWQRWIQALARVAPGDRVAAEPTHLYRAENGRLRACIVQWEHEQMVSIKFKKCGAVKTVNKQELQPYRQELRDTVVEEQPGTLWNEATAEASFHWALLRDLSRPQGSQRQLSMQRREPTAAQCDAELRRGDQDWTKPIFAAGPRARVPPAVMEEWISHSEWVQMRYLQLVLDEAELESGSEAHYALGQKHFAEFWGRYPLETTFSAAHRHPVGVFSAVWKEEQIEKMLIDFLLHEAGTRGNSWNTVRGKLYAIRHHNIRSGRSDPLLNKLRLRQLLRALKKLRGPKGAKHPVTVGMLKMMELLLEHESDDDDLVTWAAVLTAWHLLMRSAEFCAKLKGGKFDMDRVLRYCDVRFYIQGRRTLQYMLADEVRVTFGKQKNSDGGEVRSIYVMEHKLCAVRALGRLFVKVNNPESKAPLFSWLRGSRRRGAGLRYCDLVSLIKSAAEKCGYDKARYASHSIRRGAASSLLLTGKMSLDQVRLFGRWRGEVSVALYVEDGARAVAKSAAWAAVREFVGEELLERQPPRARSHRDAALKEVAKKLRLKAVSVGRE